MNPDKIVSILKTLIIITIVFIVLMILLGSMYGPFMSTMKNNSGAFSGTKILMMVAVVVALYFLLSYLFKPKYTVRASQSRSEE